MGLVAEIVRPVRTVNTFHITEEAAHEIIHVRDVVTVLRSFVAHLFDGLVPFEVDGKCLLQLGHGQLLGVVHKVLDGVQRVGGIHARRGDTQGLAVLGASGFLTEPFFDATFEQARAENVGDQHLTGGVAEIADLALYVVTVIHMLQEGLIERFKGFKPFNLGYRRENLLLRVRVPAVVQGEFDQLGKVRLPFEGHIGPLSRHACTYAAKNHGAGPSLIQRDAAAGKADQRTGHGGVHIHELRLAGPFPHHVHGLFEIGLFHLRRVEKSQSGLDVLHDNLRIHEEQF